MAQSKAVTGQFSPVAGNTVRRCYDSSGHFLGIIMTEDGQVKFKAGEVYDFKVHPAGGISQPTENGLHYFGVRGPYAWTNYFKYETEE